MEMCKPHLFHTEGKLKISRKFYRRKEEEDVDNLLKNKLVAPSWPQNTLVHTRWVMDCRKGACAAECQFCM